MRPIDIARKLRISTSALRNYEAQGIVPAADRSSSGYRMYTEVHAAYFECLQVMTPGFGIETTSEVLRKLQVKDVDSALRLVNEIQANLHRDRILIEETIDALETRAPGTPDTSGMEDWKTIGEVSDETQIPSSAIRYWEKAGLITSSRDPQNGYRIFNRSQIRKIQLLSTLRQVEYSFDVIGLKQAIAGMDHNDVEQIRRVAGATLDYMNNLTREQLRGGYYLFGLCRMLNLLDGKGIDGMATNKTEQETGKKPEKLSGHQQVVEFLHALEHPLKTEIEEVRRIILSAHDGITEHIKWKAPSFCHHHEDRVTFNLHGKGFFLLIFHCGSKVKDRAGEGRLMEDPSGLLEWVTDDRATLKFTGRADVEAAREKLPLLITKWLEAASS
ncbi:MerR family DNA-binding transcriptional regulator [Paenibacillus mendelii]|uniref:MerR family DNA-binding transcriptional regulator n=1 Tax=Paenibacillus mendelii TaxID=206163 RepID=A0ABV6JL60_9BACL|nr:MerR family DNA-binding transcriptional regulator [Paenibacillus mendelii]